MIDRADRPAEVLGIPRWGADEAGPSPSPASPLPGPSWQPQGMPAHRPHEYLRGGTAKLLTLLQQEVTALLAALPPVPDPTAPGRRVTDWWGGRAIPRPG